MSAVYLVRSKQQADGASWMIDSVWTSEKKALDRENFLVNSGRHASMDKLLTNEVNTEKSVIPFIFRKSTITVLKSRV